MQSISKTSALLVSLLLMSGILEAQARTPSCQGQPLSIEAEAASIGAASNCNGMAPACERLPKLAEDLVFVGVVTKMTESPARMMLNGVCEDSIAQTVTLAVQESFSGGLPHTITVRAGYTNGHWFHPKEVALVFAKTLSDGTRLASGCHTETIGTWNLPAKQALAYLRSRDKLPPTGSLFGFTYAVPPPSVNDRAIPFGFGNQSLTITGPISAKLKSTMNGSFRLDGIPPGSYMIHLDSPWNVEPARDQLAVILPKGCAEIHFVVDSGDDYRRITGAYRKSRAKP